MRWWAPAIAGVFAIGGIGGSDAVLGRSDPVAAYVAQLPDEMRATYTLMHTSRSRQGASDAHPRAILFSRDAKVIVTFNGKPTQAGYDEIEEMRFRDDTKTFELRVGPAPWSAPNPTACAACHGQSPRPIWDSYPTADRPDGWVGAYGQHHDFIHPAELSPFRQFVVAAKTHPRYRLLVRRPDESDLYPYLPSWTLDHEPHTLRPNNRLGKLLARLQAQRITHMIQRSPFFHEHPYTTLSWLVGCRISAEMDRAVTARFTRALPGVRIDEDGRFPLMMEQLLTGPDVGTWNLNNHPGRWLSGKKPYEVGIDQLVAARVIEQMARDRDDVRRYYRPWRYDTLYDYVNQVHPPGVTDRNVKPGYVGDAYDSLGLYFDPKLASQGCHDFSRRAREELQG